jgi:hypothetical protein
MRQITLTILAAFALSSCRPYIFLPETNPDPQLSKAKEFQAAANTWTGSNLQISYSPFEHFGVSLNGYHMGHDSSFSVTSAYRLRYGGSLMIGGYYKPADHILLEAYAGAGLGHNQAFNYESTIVTPFKQFYFVNNDYYSAFATPALSYISKNVCVGLNLKISYTQFVNVHNVESFGRDSAGSTIPMVEPANVILAEPIFVVKAGGQRLKGTFQLGFPFMPVKHGYTNDDIGLFYPLVLNFGIEFRIGLGKK